MQAATERSTNLLLQHALERAWSGRPAAQIRQSSWILRGTAGTNGLGRDYPIDRTPFRIGRDSGVALTLPCSLISKLHAEFLQRRERLWLRDLGSTNGSYLNGSLVSDDAEVLPGDMVQFGEVIFIVEQSEEAAPQGGCHTIQRQGADSAMAVAGFNQLIKRHELIVPHFQPIVRIADASTMAFEILGRCRVPGLESPKEMFNAAAKLSKEAELSRLLRKAGLQFGPSFSKDQLLFVNAHPAELVEPNFYQSLRELREEFPELNIVLEINEHSMVEVAALRRLHAELKALNIKMAFDDVGKGQSRLLELAEVPPDFIKVDIDFIRGIHEAPVARQRMLAMLVSSSAAIGAVTIAEGVECEEERAVCAEMGFQLAQGFFFGRPAPRNRVS